MARITHFEQLETIHGSRRHTDVDCGHRVVDLPGGRLLQLDTYGSNERQMPGKTSQSIQLDEAAARDLVRVLLKAFPQLRRELGSA